MWKHIKDEDLRGYDGKYLQTAWDIAIMLPILEMAGFSRSKYIPEKLYTYNQETPHNDYKLYALQSMKDAGCVMDKKAYQYKETF